MTTSQFIAINKTGKEPQFKQLIGLKPLGRTSELLDFCTLAHPNTAKHGQDNQCQVFTKDRHYIYKMYAGAIVRTEINTGKKRIFNHSIK